MDESNNTQQTKQDTKVNIINTVKTPLSFFVLVVLIVEVIFGISASISTGIDKTYLIVGMLSLIFLMVLIVAGMALFRPSALYGISVQPTPPKNLQNEGQVNANSKSENNTNVDLSKFFGKDIFTDDFKVIYGLFSRIPFDDKSVDELPKVYQKIYNNKTVYKMRAPHFVTTADSLRGITYFVQEFSKYRENHFTIWNDADAIPSYHNNSYLTIGGPVINELSDLALNEKSNKFLKFSIDLEQKNLPYIETLNGEKFERPNESGKDYGIVVKIKNSRAPGKYIFICAGIGAIGTSAAVWYLTHYWKQLYKKFGAKEFGIVIETEREQDNMAKCIYEASA